jgi:hypothetical protein
VIRTIAAEEEEVSAVAGVVDAGDVEGEEEEGVAATTIVTTKTQVVAITAVGILLNSSSKLRPVNNTKNWGILAFLPPILCR